MSEKRSVQLFIQDVFDAIGKINSYVSGITGEKELKNDEKTYEAVIWNFTVIGEAVKNIYEEVRKNNPEVEWKEIMAMRNLMVHEYWGINEGVVWDAIKNNLPELKSVITKIKNSLRE